MPIEVPRDYVYLDWAATAPLSEESLEAMKPYLVVGTANIALGMNANSLHAPGRAAFEAMELARRSIAKMLGAKRPNEIVFTSGATEADNAAIDGLAKGMRDERKKRGNAGTCKVIVSAIEHDAVLAPARRLAAEGFDVVVLNPDRSGFVTPDALRNVIDESCVLVSVQMANSEIGSIQPIEELAAIAHVNGALFHTDATQALGKVPINVTDLGVDAASFSAHKIGGPKGIGALYIKARTPFQGFQLGGGQESGLRSGTQNVCGIVGFEAACKVAVESTAQESSRLMQLRDWLYGQLASYAPVIKTVPVEPGSDAYLPNIVHVIVKDIESETMVLRLDKLGYGVSGGSACSSHSLEPSHVLNAIGVSDDLAYGALRISMGRYTTQEELEGFLQAFAECIGCK